jgi:hypothetical protein
MVGDEWVFGGRDEEWEAIKDEYRQIKIDI